MQTLETGFRSTTTAKISPSDTQIFIKKQPAITTGRIYLSNSLQEEWVDFDGVTTVGSVYRLDNCVRGLSQSADPATAGTGLTWIAGTVVKIVLMHDQPLDKQNDQSMKGKLDFGANEGRLEFPEYTTAQRDAIVTWANGEVIHNTTTGTLQQRLGGSWNDFGNTGTPDGSETVAGKVEIATDGEVTSGTDIGSTGAPLVPKPSQLKIFSPVGIIFAYPAASAPTGFLLCDGSAVSRTTYAALFALISTTYGAGDGSTTFNIPNMKGKTIVGYNSSETEFDTLGETGGAKTHTLSTTEMPAHTHGISGTAVLNTGGSGTFYVGSGATQQSSSVGGGGAHNNLQPYITLNYIIKT